MKHCGKAAVADWWWLHLRELPTRNRRSEKMLDIQLGYISFGNFCWSGTLYLICDCFRSAKSAQPSFQFNLQDGLGERPVKRYHFPLAIGPFANIAPSLIAIPMN